MSRAGFTRLQAFGLALSVLVVAFVKSQHATAQISESELNITLACIDIESSTYEQFQQNLDSLAKARNCQRGGLPRHELTGVFGTAEIRNAITSLVDERRATIYWFKEAKLRRGRGIDVPTGP